MLIYHQYHDTYHCIFRLLSVLSFSQRSKLEFDKLRLLDFYFVFPHLAADIEYPRFSGAAKIRKTASKFAPPYEMLPDKKLLFSEMGDFQIQAAQLLKAKRIVCEEGGGVVVPGPNFRAKGIADIISASRYNEMGFFGDLVSFFEDWPLLGDNGLKRRTGLMEYRYDPV